MDNPFYDNETSDDLEIAAPMVRPSPATSVDRTLDRLLGRRASMSDHVVWLHALLAVADDVLGDSYQL